VAVDRVVDRAGQGSPESRGDEGSPMGSSAGQGTWGDRPYLW
jgi:hypothetical protein